jgi:hypothetical protein
MVSWGAGSSAKSTGPVDSPPAPRPAASWEWPRYYWNMCKHFGRECYRTWRQELFASVIVVLFTAVFTGGWKDFRTALLATGMTLGCFALSHLLRVPFLLHKSMHGIAHEGNPPGFLAGAFGVIVIAAVFVGGYKLGVSFWNARPLGEIAAFPSADHGAKDAVIAQQKAEINRLMLSHPSAAGEDLGTQIGRLFPSQRARMSFENIHFMRETLNIGKVPLEPANTPWQKVQPDGTVLMALPLGFQGRPITVEVKIKNIGELYALDIHWFGGVVLSGKLDVSGEDALFERMKKLPLDAQPELKPQEVETLVIKGETGPPVKDMNDVVQKKKFPYLVLVGKFHDKLGPLPTAEFCGHYGGDDQWFATDQACIRHNQ